MEIIHFMMKHRERTRNDEMYIVHANFRTIFLFLYFSLGGGKFVRCYLQWENMIIILNALQHFDFRVYFRF